MLVYHGSTLEILNPDILHSKRFVDFGIGFYVTSFAIQAEKWAYRKAMRKSLPAIVNVYEFNNYENFNIKKFDRMDEDWLNFVCDCRNGSETYKAYDAVIGNIADDDVFKCVNMYIDGIWDISRTLQELKYYKKNDQIALLTQKIIDETLSFVNSYKVTSL
ncbi:MAG: DUF3990 domain-containing protein [Proteobacteria bacterium]|nr:DUF3990 domain-containing protein [Pseudomonadota bacterium]